MTEPLAACVHHLVERQALRTPEQVAVVFGERSLSYRMLDREAARWACRLRQLGVGPDVLVGLVVALVALLGAREIMVEAKKDGVKSHGST